MLRNYEGFLSEGQLMLRPNHRGIPEVRAS